MLLAVIIAVPFVACATLCWALCRAAAEADRMTYRMIMEERIKRALK